MSKFVSTALLIAILATVAPAQDDPVLKPIQIEVLIAEAPGEVPAEDKREAVVEYIRGLQKAGKLTAQTRAQLTTVPGFPATAQFGERTPIAVTRSAGVGSRGEGPTSFTYQNLGTHIQILPKLQGESFVVECKIEQTRLFTRKPSERGDSSVQPETIGNFSANSTVALKRGETRVLASETTQRGSETTARYILVSVLDPGGDQ
jgi:hypothetical protein